MIVIGLTGGICSGKSTVSEILQRFGAQVIDADKLGHRAYETGSLCYYKLIEAFGEGILTEDEGKSINRRALGDIVFKDSQQMKVLQDIVWPEIRRMIIECIEESKSAGKDRVVVEAAVMIEAGWNDLMDVIWVVEVPKELAIERLMNRNNLSSEQAQSRLEAQLSNEQRRVHATAVIDNTTDRSNLEAICRGLWDKL